MAGRDSLVELLQGPHAEPGPGVPEGPAGPAERERERLRGVDDLDRAGLSTLLRECPEARAAFVGPPFMPLISAAGALICLVQLFRK